jgi:hypothetical protein
MYATTFIVVVASCQEAETHGRPYTVSVMYGVVALLACDDLYQLLSA